MAVTGARVLCRGARVQFTFQALEIQQQVFDDLIPFFAIFLQSLSDDTIELGRCLRHLL